jgi:DNA-binding protein H-NS
MKKLENQSIDELEALRTKIDAVLTAKRNEQKAEVRAKIMAEIRAAGFTPDEVIGSTKSNGHKRKRTADPSRAVIGPNGEKWSGYGRRPAWASEMQTSS